MATVTITENGIDIEIVVSRVNGSRRVEARTRSRTDQPVVPYGREQTDLLYAEAPSAPVSVIPQVHLAALAAFLDWCEAAAKARWQIP